MEQSGGGSRSFAFPPGALECRPGDFLICRRSDLRWMVHRVDDILLVQRLVATSTSPAWLLIEADTLDSMGPAYADEVQLLLTAFDPDFENEPAAKDAIERKALTERVRGLLRPAREFSQTQCRVLRPAAEW